MRVPHLKQLTTVFTVLALTGLYFTGPSDSRNAHAAAGKPGPLMGAGKPPAADPTPKKPSKYQFVDNSSAASLKTTTPIKHLVVIFQENVSFDHYFATYPNAANPPGEPQFTAAPNTPAVNNLQSTGLLSPNNPNSLQPFRLDRTQVLTCDQNHDYTPEQKAVDNALLDRFVEYTEGAAGNARQYCPKGIVMGYYDGNTVTALWSYAQHFAMNDESFGTTFGPSTPGVLNLI